MSGIRYTVDDLQVLDERCYAEASQLGLEPPTTTFHLVQAEEMYDISARGLPGRYSHYQFGRSYEQQKRDYDTGKARIYELVVNTRPVHAYLLDGNSIVAQLLVMAHVYGHGVMYEHNAYFKPADKNILSRVRSAAERVDRYIGEYGRVEVENFIDACEALQFNASLDQLGKRSSPQEPKLEVKDFDELFPEETAERKKQYQADRIDFRRAFPRQPERDILRFVEKYSPRLEAWQRDIISIIRTERDYFTPQMRSKILHEGVATYYHQHIVHKLMAEDDRFTSDDFMEFQGMNASVLHPRIKGEDLMVDDKKRILVHCVDHNPYLLGFTILQELERLCIDPTKKEKEQWPWAGETDPQEKRNEIIQSYDDVALLSEFITSRVCEKAKLFIRPRLITEDTNEYKKLHVSEEEAEEVRQEMARYAMTHGAPVIEVVNGDGRARGELWMEHRVDPAHQVGLDMDYAKGTMQHLASLWGRACVIHTISRTTQSDMWVYCEPDKVATAHTAINF